MAKCSLLRKKNYHKKYEKNVTGRKCDSHAKWHLWDVSLKILPIKIKFGIKYGRKKKECKYLQYVKKTWIHN